MKHFSLFVFSLLFLASIQLQAQWDTLSNGIWSNYHVTTCTIGLDNQDNLYAAYMANNGYPTGVYSLTVSEFLNNNWSYLGVPFSGFATQAPSYSMAFDNMNSVYIAGIQIFSDSLSSLIVLKYDTSSASWLILNNETIYCPNGSACSLVADNSNNLYVAYVDYANNARITVQKYNGTGWSVVGTTDSIGSFPSLNIQKNGGTVYMAYEDTRHKNNATVLNVNTWSVVGSAGFTTDISYNPALCTDNSGNIYMSYCNDTSRVKVMKYNGNSWSYFGTLGQAIIRSSSITVGADGKLYAAFCGESSAQIMSRPANGSSNWSNVGNPTLNAPSSFSAGLCIDMQNHIYACYASSPGLMTIEKFHCIPDVPTLGTTNAAICLGGLAQLSVTNGRLNSGSDWYWFSDSCNGPFADSGATIDVAPRVKTTYFVKGVGGCAVQDSCASITVSTNSLVTASVFISASADSVCISTLVTFTAQAVNGGVAPVYLWKKNGLEVGSNSAHYTDNTLQNGDIISCNLISGLCTNSYSQSSNKLSIYIIGATAKISDSGPLTFCTGDSLTLVANGGATSYLWNNDSSEQSITVTQSGIYAVTVSTGNCSSSDSIKVTASVLLNPLIDNSGASAFCAGGTITLDGGPGYDSYLWSTGDSTEDITQDTAGIYSLTVTQGTCTGSVSDTILMKNLQVRINSDSASINGCNGDTILLDAGAGYNSYLWNNGSQNEDIYIADSGLYSVTVTKNGCAGGDSVRVHYNAIINPVIISTGGFLVICPKDSVDLTTNIVYDSYKWNTGATTEAITTSDTGIYSVVVSKNGCVAVAYTPKIAYVQLPDSVTLIFVPDSSFINKIYASVTYGNNYVWQLTDYNYGFPNQEGPPNTDSIAVYCYLEGSDPAPYDTANVPFGTLIRVIAYIQGCADSSAWIQLDQNCAMIGGNVHNVPDIYNISVYPNPGNDKINISYQLGNAMDVQISIFNLTGQQIFALPAVKANAGLNNQTINVGLFPEGIYTILMATENGSVNRKFVKLNN